MSRNKNAVTSLLVFLKKGPAELEQSFHVAWSGRDYACMSTNFLKKRATTSLP